MSVAEHKSTGRPRLGLPYGVQYHRPDMQPKDIVHHWSAWWCVRARYGQQTPPWFRSVVCTLLQHQVHVSPHVDVVVIVVHQYLQQLTDNFVRGENPAVVRARLRSRAAEDHDGKTLQMSKPLIWLIQETEHWSFECEKTDTKFTEMKV